MMKWMYPILGRYGPFFLHSYTVILGAALLSGLVLLRRPARRAGFWRWWEGTVVALFAGLVAGRLGYVALHADYFRLHPEEGWMVWQGGLSYHAALPAVLAVLALWAGHQGISFYRLAALLAPVALLWGAAVWLACWFEGCAYGRETSSRSLLAANLPDTYGVYALRYQVQLLGMAVYLFLAAFVSWLRGRLAPAPLFWMAVALASGSRGLLTLCRGDTVPVLADWRLDTLLDIFMAAAAAGLFLRTWDSRPGLPRTQSRGNS